MNRRLLAAFILISILYFPLGWIAVSFSWMPTDLYFSVAAVVGGLASIFGLIAFIRPPLSREDVKNLEWESVARVASAAKEVEVIEARKAVAHSELTELTRTKDEMAALVKKAGLALFLREEQTRVEEKIIAAVTENKVLFGALEEYREYSKQIRALDEEIEGHPDAALLSDIVARARIRERKLLSEILQQIKNIPLYGPFLESFLRLLMALLESLSRAAKLIVEGRK